MIDPDRPGVDALRARARRRLSTIADATRSRRRWRRCPDDTVLRGVAAAGVLYSYPFVAHTALGLARDRADGADHRAPEQGRPAAPARRGCQEPDLRRHAAVRYRQVLGLRPLRDGHARQRRPAVHACRPTTASTRAPCSARASISPATTRMPIRASTRPASSTSRRSAASRPTARTTSPASTCRRSRAQPRSPRPASTRRTGACGATTRSLQRQLRPAVRLGGLHLHAFRSRTGLLDKQQDIMTSARPAADRPLERAGHRCATTSMPSSASRTRSSSSTPTNASC